jgi:hypothetical protein
MRYFFYIVDKSGLSRTERDVNTPTRAAVVHARRIAAELAKAGEFFRSGIVVADCRSRTDIPS